MVVENPLILTFWDSKCCIIMCWPSFCIDFACMGDWHAVCTQTKEDELCNKFHMQCSSSFTLGGQRGSWPLSFTNALVFGNLWSRRICGGHLKRQIQVALCQAVVWYVLPCEIEAQPLHKDCIVKDSPNIPCYFWWVFKDT